MSGCGTGVTSRPGPRRCGPGRSARRTTRPPVLARAEQVAVQWTRQPLGEEHRPAGERAAAGPPGGVDAGQADRRPLRQVGLPVPDDLAPVAAGGVHPDLLAGAAQLVAPADDDLRVGVGVAAPQGARGDVLDVEPPPARVQSGRLGTGQRVGGIRGSGCPQPARALTVTGPATVGRGQVGGGRRAGHHVRVHHAAHRPGPGRLLPQAGADRPGTPSGDLDDREVHRHVGQGATALRPPDVGAPAGAHGGFDGGRWPGPASQGDVRFVDRHRHGVGKGCSHRVGGQLRGRSGLLRLTGRSRPGRARRPRRSPVLGPRRAGVRA